jgi:hypothetical protein
VSLNKAVKKKHYFGRKVQVFTFSGQTCTVLHRKCLSKNGGVELGESHGGQEILISNGQKESM